MAKGSLLMAMCTLPRLIFEYIQRQTKGASEQSALSRALVAVTRCGLWCLQSCMQFLTKYAYVFVAVSGRSFCPAARLSFVHLSRNAPLVALNQVASVALKGVACITVPLAMAGSAFFLVEFMAWQACAIVICGLAFVTSRLLVGVYDSCLAATFVCMMLDEDRSVMPAELYYLCELEQEHSQAEMRRPVVATVVSDS